MSLENVILSDIRPDTHGAELENNSPDYIHRDGSGSFLNSKLKSAEKNNAIPPDPEKFISRYILKKSQKDPEFGGVEKLSEVTEVFSDYMGFISRGVDTSLTKGKDTGSLLRSIVGRRCSGCESFINYMINSGYFSPEIVDESSEVLRISTEILSVIDLNTFESNKSSGSEQKAAVLAHLVDLSVKYPSKADQILSIVDRSCPKNNKSRESFKAYIEGALAEILTVYSILDSEALSSGDFEVLKPGSYDDVYRGIDFVIRRKKENGKSEDVLYFDVKKGNIASYGVCNLVFKDNNIVTRSHGMELPNLLEEFAVEDNVINCLKKDSVPFVVVRMKPSFDFSTDQDYNDFSTQIKTEVNERIKETY